MLTRKQHELLSFISDRLGETGVSPSFEEMKEALDLKSKSGVHRLVSALEERNFIRRLPNRARALEVMRLPDGMRSLAAVATGTAAPRMPAAPPVLPRAPMPILAAANDVLEIPLHGRIAAGVPIEAIEGQSMLSVPAALLGPGEHYALEVSGDSMVEAGILDGDYALVRRQEQAHEGDIVVALVHGDRTLKRLARIDGRFWLIPEAEGDSRIIVDENVEIWGVLDGVARRLP